MGPLFCGIALMTRNIDSLYFLFLYICVCNSKTGLLNASVHPEAPLYHESLYQMRKHGWAHKVLSQEELKRDYPELDLPPNAMTFMDYDSGILRADRALRAFQVWRLIMNDCFVLF